MIRFNELFNALQAQVGFRLGSPGGRHLAGAALTPSGHGGWGGDGKATRSAEAWHLGV